MINYLYEDDPSTDLAQVMKLIEFPPIHMSGENLSPVYGYSKATILGGCVDTHLLNYSWPDEERHQVLPTRLHGSMALSKHAFLGHSWMRTLGVLLSPPMNIINIMILYYYDQVFVNFILFSSPGCPRFFF